MHIRLSGCLLFTIVIAAGCDRIQPAADAAPGPDAAPACTTPAECDDGDPCNGSEICAGTCQPGSPQPGGTACSSDAVTGGECRAFGGTAVCVTMGCGDGTVDGTEVCDDGNTAVNDGCEIDCHFSCETNPSVTHTWYADCDNDGVAGLAGSTSTVCLEPAPASCGGGWTLTMPIAGADDCDDTRNNVYPNAPEGCGDNIDNDCDGLIDEDGATTWFFDGDGDGFGLNSSTIVTCSPPGNYASMGGDCNDSCFACNTNGSETSAVCDGLDQDCDGTPDDGVLITFYRDADGDNYGNPNQFEMRCSPTPGYVNNMTDCDDTNPAVSPADPEVCFNNVDDDCDAPINGTQDEAAECFIACDWSGSARWLSHGWDGDAGNPNASYKTGVWVTCSGNTIAFMDWVNINPPPGTFSNPGPLGTGDPLVGCNWNGSRFASQGYNMANAFTFGANVSCNGSRITGLGWANNQVPGGFTPVITSGQLGCNWTGAKFLTHGWDGGCAVTGFNVTCNDSHITHVEATEAPGCPF